MQFNGEGIFFMLTANDVDGIHDALIDRLDVWSVDLPTQTEREQIWAIHIARRRRNPKKFDVTAAAKLTDGFSGRQIEQVWLKAMEIAFNNDAREPQQADIVVALQGFVATSVTMAEAIKARRERLASRAKPASKPEAPRLAAVNGRKIAA